MKWIFWSAAILIVYTYFGYPAWLWLRKCLRSKPVKKAASTPLFSVVMVVRNEAAILERKLRNLLSLDYPADRYEIIAISDGSEDSTNQILTRYAMDRQVHIVLNPSPQGKAASLNEAIALASGELVMFTDVRQYIEPEAMKFLAANFADPAIGCVSGELILGDPQAGESAKGVGLYWRMEKHIRELESATGSVVGATGAIYAVRRKLLVSLPPETILDDVFIPMNVVRQGARVAFDPTARAWDDPDLGREREFARKVRTLSGNYQLLQLAPWLLTRDNPLRFEFVSHKLLRLAAPFLLVSLLGSSFLVRQPFYRIAFWLQAAFYALGALALRLTCGPVARVADAALTFVTLNTAAVVAFANFVTGRKPVWIR
jgi:biofilm PGA synthesis N-glycosyltransferase PgaC